MRRAISRGASSFMEHEALTRTIIGAAMRVHSTLGPGFLESVYRNALAWELRRKGLPVECERRLRVHYRDAIVGDFVADMLIDGRLIVELKAAVSIEPGHEAQILNYLAATGIGLGLLLNFGASRLEMRRKTREFAVRGRKADGLRDESRTGAG